MSCQLCHYILGHSTGCQFFREGDAADNASLSARVDVLEREHAQLVADLKLSDSAGSRAVEHATANAAVEVIRGILERLPDEAARKAVLKRVLENRCRKCLDHDPNNSFWCCYESRG